MTVYLIIVQTANELENPMDSIQTKANNWIVYVPTNFQTFIRLRLDSVTN